jgi:serine protease Do/serine protease DegQ
MSTKTNWLAGLLLGASTLAPPLTLVALPVADSQNEPLPTLAPMLDKVTPAVVNISTRGSVRVQENPLLQDPFFRRFFDIPDQPQRRETQSLGSGVVVDAQQGLIITNNHVIQQAEEISVTLRDGRTLSAKVVGTDPEADVAVIKVPAERLTAIPMSDSEQLRVGDFVVAIGNPFGLGQTVTSGIVSALGRTGLGIEGYEDFIQTDASINPGNSGGALVNLRGELVGMNTAIIAPGGGNVGIGFAIPANMVRDIMEQLVKFGEVRRGRLGVSIQDLTPELASAFGLEDRSGAVISQVVPGSPADKSGIKVGDVVMSVNGRGVRNSGELRNRIGMLRIGERVQLRLLRDGKMKEVTATVAEAQQQKLAGKALFAKLEGAVFGNIEELPSNTSGRDNGVIVLDVERGSPAARAGLRKDDIVYSANRVAIANLDDLKRAAKRSDQGILLNIQRGDAALFLLVR